MSDQGQLIRVKVSQIRIAGRNTQGVTIFRKGDQEHVVSVERLEGAAEDSSEGETEAPDAPSSET